MNCSGVKDLHRRRICFQRMCIASDPVDRLPSAPGAAWSSRPASGRADFFVTDVPKTAMADEAFSFGLKATQGLLSLGDDYFVVALVGPTISLCEDFSQGSVESIRVTCRVADSGLYKVSVTRVFTGAEGLRLSAAEPSKRTRVLSEAVPRPAVEITGRGARPFGNLHHLPPCNGPGAPAGRWVQSSLVCRSSPNSSHRLLPSCSLPPVEGSWRWLPYSCLYHPWGSEGLSRALGGRRILLLGDSTMRYLFGALLNLLDPDPSRRFKQVGYGCQRSDRIDGGAYTFCSHFNVTTFRGSGGVIVSYAQPLAAGKSDAQGCHDLRADRLPTFLRATPPPDAVLVQIPWLSQYCNDHEPLLPSAVSALLPLLNALSPPPILSRRTAMAWSPWSVPPDHCVSLQLSRSFERRISKAMPGLLLQGGGTVGGGGGDGNRDARAGAPPDLDLLQMTLPLYAVENSVSVHATPHTNAMLAHIAATHLVGMLRHSGRRRAIAQPQAGRQRP